MADAIDAFMAQGAPAGGDLANATFDAPAQVPAPGGAPGTSPEADAESMAGIVGDQTDTIGSAVTGALKAGFEAKDAVLGETPYESKSTFRRMVEGVGNARHKQTGVVGVTNNLAQGIGQFATGFIGIGKITKPLGMVGPAWDLVRGGVAGALVFDPHEARLSNLVEQFPALQNPVTSYLMAKPDDSAAKGRFKAALENLLLPGMAEGGIAAARGASRTLTALVDAIKLRRAGNIDGANNAVTEAEKGLQRLTKGLQEGDNSNVNAPAAATPDNPAAGGDAVPPPAGEAPSGPGVLGDAPAGGPQGAGDQAGAGGAGAAGEGPGAGVAGGLRDGQPQVARVPDNTKVRPDNPLPQRVEYTPEQINEQLAKSQKDVGAILDSGSYDAAAADGHVFAQTDLIPWQKLDGGDGIGARAWFERTVSEQEAFIQKARGGNTGGAGSGVLGDKAINRMIDARVEAFGEDPALLRGMILQAGDKARTMAANMEAAYVISQKGMIDTYSLAQRINAGNFAGFESEEVAKAALKSRLVSTMEMFGAAKAMTAAAGRTMRRMRGEFAVNAEQLQKLNIDNVDPDALTTLILSTQGNPRAMAQLGRPGFINQATDYLTTMQAANLLWGWSTQTINMVMNVATLYQRPVTQWMGGRALQAIGKVGRDGDLVANAGAAAQIARKEMVTTHTYLADAWNGAKFAFLQGDSRLAPHTSNEFFGQGAQGAVRPGVQPLPELANMWRNVETLDDVAYNAMVSAMNTMSVPLRVMGSADEFTKVLRYRAVVGAKADADAVAQGLKPGTKEYASYMEGRMRAAFDDTGAALDVDALHEAKTTTFSQDLIGAGTSDTVGGWKSIGALVQQGVGAVPPSRLVVPFIKTPANLFRYGWRLTPGLNLLQKQYLNALTGKAGPEAQSMATGEMMLGIMLASTALSLRMAGRITGGGPIDAKMSKAWKDDGNQPYSIVVPNKDGSKTYVQLSRMDPVQFPLAIAADAADLYLQGHLTEDQEAGVGMAIVLALSHQLKNKTYLKNVSDFLNAISDDSRMKSLPQRMAPGFLPFSTLLQGATQMQDPILHEVHGVLDALKARTPGFSDSVPPRRDWGGDVVMVPGKFLSDQKLRPALADALNEIYQVTGQYMQNPSPRTDRIPGVDLRDITLENGRSAYDRYQELAGNPSGKLPLKDVLGRLVETDAYKVLPHGRMSEAGTKENALNKIVAEYRDAGMKRLLAESPTMRNLAMKRHHDLLGQLQTNVSDLRAAQAKGAAEGINKLLEGFGMQVPVPRSDIPAQQ